MAGMPEHEESRPQEPMDAVEHDGERPAPEEGERREPDPRPLSRLAERFRVPLGVVVGVLGLGLAVLFALRPTNGTGTGAVIAHVAGVVLWICVAAVGATWAARLPRRVTNLCAVAGIVAYVITWLGPV